MIIIEEMIFKFIEIEKKRLSKEMTELKYQN
jgi:hypothetical protein